MSTLIHPLSCTCSNHYRGTNLSSRPSSTPTSHGQILNFGTQIFLGSWLLDLGKVPFGTHTFFPLTCPFFQTLHVDALCPFLPQ